MEAERRTRKVLGSQKIDQELTQVMYVYYVCMCICMFSRISRDCEHLQKRKWYDMVGSWIMHCLGVLLAQWGSQRERGTWSKSVTMVRAVVARTVRDLGLDSLLPKLSELKWIRDASLVNRKCGERDPELLIHTGIFHTGVLPLVGRRGPWVGLSSHLLKPAEGPQAQK